MYWGSANVLRYKNVLKCDDVLRSKKIDMRKCDDTWHIAEIYLIILISRKTDSDLEYPWIPLKYPEIPWIQLIYLQLLLITLNNHGVS